MDRRGPMTPRGSVRSVTKLYLELVEKQTRLLWMTEADDAVLAVLDGLLAPDHLQRAVDRALARLTASNATKRRQRLEAEQRELDRKIANLVAAVEKSGEIAAVAETLRQRE